PSLPRPTLPGKESVRNTRTAEDCKPGVVLGSAHWFPRPHEHFATLGGEGSVPASGGCETPREGGPGGSHPPLTSTDARLPARTRATPAKMISIPATIAPVMLSPFRTAPTTRAIIGLT